MCYKVRMYIATVPNRASPPAILLRESYRDGGRVKTRTLANLSKCPPEAVEALRLALRGVELVPKDEVFSIERSLPHGHVQAVLGTMNTLGMNALLASRPCRERDLVMAMLAQRLLDPCSKLATTRLWHTTTLAQELGVEDANAHELYDALDWLLERQGRIEKRIHPTNSSFSISNLCNRFSTNARVGKKSQRRSTYLTSGISTTPMPTPVS